MIVNDPKQAIIEFFCTPHGKLEAREGTFHFLQSRSLPDQQIYEVIFKDQTGRLNRWICFLIQEPDGTWNLAGSAAVGDHDYFLPKDQPVACLAGGNVVHFWMGGKVLDRGVDVARVRLIASNGQILEDMVQDNIVLFLTKQKLLLPIQVELYDRTGNLVGTHPWPPIPFL